MRQSKEDLINKVETLVGEIENLSKTRLDRRYYEDLMEEVNEWIEDLRHSKVEFIQ